MTNNNNVIRLNESEFNNLIRESVVQILNENGFKGLAAKIGKGIGKAALYGALGAGTLAAVDKGIENQEKYQDKVNKEASAMQGPTEDKVTMYLQKNEMEDTPQNRQRIFDYLNHKMQNESRLNGIVAKVLKEEINKVL